jgi:hypothetical protein
MRPQHPGTGTLVAAVTQRSPQAAQVSGRCSSSASKPGAAPQPLFQTRLFRLHRWSRAPQACSPSLAATGNRCVADPGRALVLPRPAWFGLALRRRGLLGSMRGGFGFGPFQRALLSLTAVGLLTRGTCARRAGTSTGSGSASHGLPCSPPATNFPDNHHNGSAGKPRRSSSEQWEVVALRCMSAVPSRPALGGPIAADGPSHTELGLSATIQQLGHLFGRGLNGFDCTA